MWLSFLFAARLLLLLNMYIFLSTPVLNRVMRACMTLLHGALRQSHAGCKRVGGVLQRRPAHGQPLGLHLFFDHSLLEIFTSELRTLSCHTLITPMLLLDIGISWNMLSCMHLQCSAAQCHPMPPNTCVHAQPLCHHARLFVCPRPTLLRTPHCHGHCPSNIVSARNNDYPNLVVLNTLRLAGEGEVLSTRVYRGIPPPGAGTGVDLVSVGCRTRVTRAAAFELDTCWKQAPEASASAHISAATAQAADLHPMQGEGFMAGGVPLKPEPAAIGVRAPAKQPPFMTAPPFAQVQQPPAGADRDELRSCASAAAAATAEEDSSMGLTPMGTAGEVSGQGRAVAAPVAPAFGTAGALMAGVGPRGMEPDAGFSQGGGMEEARAFEAANNLANLSLDDHRAAASLVCDNGWDVCVGGNRMEFPMALQSDPFSFMPISAPATMPAMQGAFAHAPPGMGGYSGMGFTGLEGYGGRGYGEAGGYAVEHKLLQLLQVLERDEAAVR